MPQLLGVHQLLCYFELSNLDNQLGDMTSLVKPTGVSSVFPWPKKTPNIFPFKHEKVYIFLNLDIYTHTNTLSCTFQAIMNYRRKSTVGWSIGNIILDFTGGFLSIFQMVVNAYNYNDWVSFFGDFTKFGLGLFSLAFDIFFMLQHYVFYRYVLFFYNRSCRVTLFLF